MATTMDQMGASTNTSAPKVSKLQLIGGWILTILPCLALLMSAVMKLMAGPQIVDGLVTKGGFPLGSLQPIGAVELLAAILVLIPRTAPFGAVLVSGYLGGAIATHVRQGDALFAHTLVPLYFALMIWGGLFLRDERVRALSPFSSQK